MNSLLLNVTRIITNWENYSVIIRSDLNQNIESVLYCKRINMWYVVIYEPTMTWLHVAISSFHLINLYQGTSFYSVNTQ